MKQKQTYALRKIAGVGLVSCLLGLTLVAGTVSQVHADESTLPSETLPSELPSNPVEETTSTTTTTPSTSEGGTQTEPSTPSEDLPSELPPTDTSESKPDKETTSTSTDTSETKPENTDKETEKPTEPEKEVTVTIDESGKVDDKGTQTTPVITTNPKEITNVPTVNKPVIADNGTKIVAVKDGVPYTQTDKGLEVANVQYKKLPSGNIEITSVDGTKKVLPKTGVSNKGNALLVALGTVLSSLSAGFMWMKKKYLVMKE
ncbi:LPXTG cell wall anchor domain-containing protein [Enterococcus cecorum]|uniref:LPXTG cell wall anchor domain-containing protein n=1 Tax=Enterococcus cecorum TaxID=44008 RepID=UPI0022DBF794|nr:LPXTG cell wall anchor domain-containing protein [Enterococcus cecorum]CAI3298911.1 LPXTG cell wall anchor domain-containing protein [Enterococcus cecorum]CAI3300534.1 LPXTG cell wall anchor domain-containing protein [Enterococcus cecorum]CAI3313070.1 LPXTG cell wall anchor domain-containing protein [Enterococcus cecorum]CAI3323055.1 LPXTG cell wall anchor domain-containing protein [Enterococcus cecorum]CAI3328167.1 LPXTG cell wall anchor domain-containing protein [Enterococcus cecorum]